MAYHRERHGGRWQVSREPIELVGADLRERRRRLVGYEQPTRCEWEADLAAYDEALRRAAAMLEVEVGVDTGAALTPDQRADLEHALAAAGLEIRTTDI
ncbi:MAG: hypothetical protein KY447_11420 [Actinobacteria bacterium]|nr:hypothetical protein [Actinomycetota bacterium]MBW3643512.1 hypothetical protein [Actinomycetota bacterium]